MINNAYGETVVRLYLKQSRQIAGSPQLVCDARPRIVRGSKGRFCRDLLSVHPTHMEDDNFLDKSHYSALKNRTRLDCFPMSVSESKSSRVIAHDVPFATGAKLMKAGGYRFYKGSIGRDVSDRSTTDHSVGWEFRLFCLSRNPFW